MLDYLPQMYSSVLTALGTRPCVLAFQAACSHLCVRAYSPIYCLQLNNKLTFYLSQPTHQLSNKLKIPPN
jgi:hypothetical protein